MYSRASTRQNRWTSLNETVRKLVRPSSPSFTGSVAKGTQTTQRIYDSTPIWAMEQLSSGMHSYLMDNSTRWFSLGLRGIPFVNLSPEAASWLEYVSDLMFAYFQDPAARMTQSVKETFLDVCSYGTGIMFQEWDSKNGRFKFRSYPLASCKIEEGADGLIDTIFREQWMSTEQIQQEWPDVTLPQNMLAPGMDQEYKVTHAVYPNEKHVTSRFLPASITKKYVSIYFIEENSLELSRGGYDVFPYYVPRWTTMAGEIYGRGPAITASPDIELLNLMTKELIMAAQLANRPPLVLDDDGFMLPIAYQPGALIFKTPGTEEPKPMQSGGNFSITLELLQRKQEQIAKTFHVDWLLREKKKERQSVHEVTDDRQEMMRQLSSVLGRLESELPSPLIKNSFYLLDRENKLPPPPDDIRGAAMEIVFTSPAAKSRDTQKAQNIMQYMADMTALGGVNQEVFDGIDFPALGQDLAVYRDVSRRVLLSPRQVAQKQQQRRQDEQAQAGLAQAQQVGQVAGALKDVATAQEKGLLLGG